jgi:hypothetical protein
MKRVIGMAVATLLSMGLMAGVAAADTTTTTTTCSIYETGSASYNSCTTDSTLTTPKTLVRVVLRLLTTRLQAMPSVALHLTPITIP